MLLYDDGLFLYAKKIVYAESIKIGLSGTGLDTYWGSLMDYWMS